MKSSVEDLRPRSDMSTSKEEGEQDLRGETTPPTRAVRNNNNKAAASSAVVGSSGGTTRKKDATAPTSPAPKAPAAQEPLPSPRGRFPPSSLLRPPKKARRVLGALAAAVLASAALGGQRRQAATLGRTMSSLMSSSSSAPLIPIITTTTREATGTGEGRRLPPPPVGRVVPVVLWPSSVLGGASEGAASIHVWWDGLAESPYLERVDDWREAALLGLNHNEAAWIAVAGRAIPWDAQCTRLVDRIANATEFRQRNGINKAWPVHVVDYSDPPEKQRCRRAERLLGPNHVFYAKRSVVKGRRWQGGRGNNPSWVRLGRVDAVLAGSGNATYTHIPFAVRTDTVEALRSVLEEERGLSLRDRIEALDRPVDVTHLWPRSDATDRGGVGSGKSQLRALVSDAIYRISREDDRNWTIVVDIVGTPARAGRQSVSSAYVETMLSTKVMVVTQRDNWEDHYRLFEALVTGALVFTDRMLSLPSGLANGTSIVEFGSLLELTRLLDHYLARPAERHRIATEGRRIAMTRHRSWHRVEEVIFGHARTVCPEDGRDPDCPYVVHANESTSLVAMAAAAAAAAAASAAMVRDVSGTASG